METVNSIASAASRAIWGTPEEESAKKTTLDNETKGTEPVSGEVGDVKAGGPYDKGNEDTTTSTLPKSTTSTTNETTLPSHPAPTSSTAPGNTPSTAPLSSSSEPTTSASLSDKPSSSNATSGPGAEPSVSALPSSAPQDTQKQQVADQPSAIPQESGENERIKETKEEAEEAQKVIAGGEAPKTLEKSKVGATVGDVEGIQKESHGEGTGEIYVKSSGMVADGGDFDASKPGAGREADRLLEEKGIKKSDSTPAAATKIESPSDSKERKSESSSEGKGVGNGEGKEKRSLKEKIKAKLHKH